MPNRTNSIDFDRREPHSTLAAAMRLPTLLAPLLTGAHVLALPLINDPPPEKIAPLNIPIDALLLPPPPTPAILDNFLKATPTTHRPTAPRNQGNLCHMPPLPRDVALPSTTTWNFGYAHKNTIVEVPAGLRTQGPCKPRRGIDRWYDSSWIVPTDHPRSKEGDWVESVPGDVEEAGIVWWREMMSGLKEGGRRG